VKLVMQEAAWLVGMCLLAGTALALAGGKTASALLFGLKPWDVATFAMAVSGLTLVRRCEFVAGASSSPGGSGGRATRRVRVEARRHPWRTADNHRHTSTPTGYRLPRTMFAFSFRCRRVDTAAKASFGCIEESLM